MDAGRLFLLERIITLIDGLVHAMRLGRDALLVLCARLQR